MYIRRIKMKKIFAIVLAMVMVVAFAACGKKDVDPNAKDDGVLDHAAYIAAKDGEEVTIEGFITEKTYAQAYGNVNFFIQDGDGAYFVYRMPCTDEDNAKLELGKKVKVTGIRTAWSGMNELKEGTASYELLDESYTFENTDVTSLLASADLIDYQGMKVVVKGASVKNAALYNWDGSGEPGSDLYLDIRVEGNDYTFVVESDLCDKDSETYKAVEGLQAGQTIDIEGYMYWYNGPQMWIKAVTVK